LVTDRKPPSPAAVTLLVVVLCLAWGSTWLVIKTGLRDLPPLTSAAMRFAIAAAVMAALAPWLTRVEGGSRPPVWLWVQMGCLNIATTYGLVYCTETVLPSGVTSVLWAVFPLLMAVSSHWFLLGEKLRPGHWLGFGLGFVGVGLLFTTDLRSFGSDGVPAGLMLLLSPLAAAISTTVIKRCGGGMSATLLNRNGFAVGAAVLFAASIVQESDREITWTGNAVFSLVYLSLVGTCLTFGLYFWLLRYAPANKLSLIAFVTPCIALLLGSTLGGEPLHWHTLAGTGAIVTGVALAVRK
jgi:drug/metabolite transporter (DMT)-like permease